MPRKRRIILSNLKKKGFEANTKSHHILLAYRTLQGHRTNARTRLSHGARGEDVSDNLLGDMARQVGLDYARFLNLVDCTMSREDFDAIVKIK